MALPKFSSPFPPLELALEDKKELCRITKQLVGEVVDGYERFLWNDREQLNPARWQLVKERDDTRVYHDRLSGAKSENKELNVLLTVGTAQGSLDDAMYGLINHTTDAMRVRGAYLRDSVSNCAVLAAILEPTLDKPFRSMTVKWGVKALPFHLRALSKNRDVVFVESTGMKTLSNGERVGFHLIHSVDFKYTQPLPQYTRANISICSVWRQQGPDRTQVYSKSFLDIPDRLLAPLMLRAAADTMVTMGRFMHVAQMKKLSWLMRRRRASVAEDSRDAVKSPGSGLGPGYDGYDNAGCAVCGAAHPHSRHSNKYECTICTRSVCATCRVRRELCYMTPDSQIVESRAAFCVPCLSLSTRAPTVDVARDEIGGGRSAEVVPILTALAKDTSITRFSYGSSRRGSVPPRETKRRSMTLSAPFKSSSTSSSSFTSIVMTPSQTPTSKEAWTPRMTPTKKGKSSSWINLREP